MKFFNNLKVKIKILLAFFILTILILTSSIFSAIQINSMKYRFASITNEEMKKIQYCYEMRGYINDAYTAFRNILVSNSLEYISDQEEILNKTLSEYNKISEELNKLLITDKGKEDYINVGKYGKSSVKVIKDLSSKAKSTNISVKEQEDITKLLNATQEQWLDSIQKILNTINEHAELEEQNTNNLASNTVKILYFILAVSVNIINFNNYSYY